MFQPYYQLKYFEGSHINTLYPIFTNCWINSTFEWKNFQIKKNSKITTVVVFPVAAVHESIQNFQKNSSNYEEKVFFLPPTVKAN
jgi:hypothetical protein